GRHRALARQLAPEDAAHLRPLRALRGAEEVADRGQHRARGHAGAAGHLPRGPRGPAAVRRSAGRRVHRVGAGAGERAMTRRSMRWAARLAWPMGLATAAGCAVGPNYHRPQIPVPPAWVESPGTSAGGAAPLETWWSAFHDAVLDRLIDRAVAGNLDLKIA